MPVFPPRIKKALQSLLISTEYRLFHHPTLRFTAMTWGSFTASGRFSMVCEHKKASWRWRFIKIYVLFDFPVNNLGNGLRKILMIFRIHMQPIDGGRFCNCCRIKEKTVFQLRHLLIKRSQLS